jgi:hypothetical protein
LKTNECPSSLLKSASSLSKVSDQKIKGEEKSRYIIVGTESSKKKSMQ